MTTPIVYIDHSDVRPGKLANVKDAISQLVAFVEEREPQLLSYGFYLDEDALAMTLVAVHPDSASLELHLEIGGPEFRKVGEFIDLQLIEVFGRPSAATLRRLHEKARMLGGARVVVRESSSGFSRISSLEHASTPAGGTTTRLGHTRRT